MSEYPRIYEEVNRRTCSTNNFESRLEIPNGKTLNQNAWLTIRVNYRLNFVDSQNLARNSAGENIILANQPEGYFVAVDSNKKKFPISDWDSHSKYIFHEKFKNGEIFWNYKFLLETPSDYADLDYKGLDGWIYRPNIICLFRLKQFGAETRRQIDVVRAKTNAANPKFRSNDSLYNHTDVNNRTVWHELGHALNQLHIQNLAKTATGLTLCVDDVNANACYITPQWMGKPNVMGYGEALHPVNAKPWLEQIQEHTNIPSSKWIARLSTNIPPKRIRRA